MQTSYFRNSKKGLQFKSKQIILPLIYDDANQQLCTVLHTKWVNFNFIRSASALF